MTDLVFRLPDVGEGLAEAEIVEWLVKVGDQVRADQPVVTVETAKAQVDLPAPADGVVRSLEAAAADVVNVGSPLFVLDTGATAAAGEPAPHTTGTADPTPSRPAAGVPGGRNGRRRLLAAPRTRRLALELGIDLTELTGTGPHGRVTPDDVRSAAETGPPAPEPDHPTYAAPAAQPGESEVDVRPLRGLRRQIARSMTAAWTVPQITEFREVDATELLRAHRDLRSTVGDQARLTLLPLLVRTVIAALRRHPMVNATIDMAAEQWTVHHRHHLGIATATQHGLIVPVLQDAHRLSIVGLAREIVRLGEAARTRSLSVEETTGGTFTISNFGSYGTWLGTPLVNAPQVAIAGFGRVRDAVVPVAGAPAVRPVLPIAVSADHRLIDGDQLGGFVNTLAQLVSSPLLLLGESD